MTSTTRRLLALATLLATLWISPAQAATEPIDTPELDTAEQRAQLALALAERVKWRSQPAAYFAMPAQGLPLPCPRAVKVIQTAAGVWDFDDPTIQRKLRRMARQQGELKTADELMKFSELQLVVVQGACQGEKPVGRFEAWLSFVVSIDLQGDRSNAHHVVRVSGEFDDADGRLARRVVVGERKTDRGIVWKDPAVAAQMAEMAARRPRPAIVVDYFTARDKATSVVLVSAGTPGEPANFTTMVVREWEDGADQRSQLRLYEGKTLSSEMRHKNGLQHGPTRVFAQQRVIAGQRIDIPASEDCYEDGELIKTLRCDVP